MSLLSGLSRLATATVTATSTATAAIKPIDEISDDSNHKEEPEQHFEHVEILNELTIRRVLVLGIADHQSSGISNAATQSNARAGTQSGAEIRAAAAAAAFSHVFYIEKREKRLFGFS
jgi:hypothetical protein